MRILLFSLIGIGFCFFLKAQQIYPYYNHRNQYEFGVFNQTYFGKSYKAENTRIYSDNYILSPGIQYHAFRKILVNNPRYSHKGMHFVLAGMGLKTAYLPVIRNQYNDRIVDINSQKFRDTLFVNSNRTIRLTASFFLDHTKDIGSSHRIRTGIGFEHHLFDVQNFKVKINDVSQSSNWLLKAFPASIPNLTSPSVDLKFRFTVDKAIDYDHFMGFGVQVLYGVNRQAFQGYNVLRPIKVLVEWHYGLFGN
jgi:hypothetical protein